MVIGNSLSVCCHKRIVKLKTVILCDELKNLIERNGETFENYYKKHILQNMVEGDCKET